MKFLARLIPLAVFAPMFAFAAPGDLVEVSTFLDKLITFINGTLVPLVFAVAFIVFLWGMFKTFILGGRRIIKKKKGKQLMMYAIVGFVVMISLWGIVNLVANGFGFQNTDIKPIIPKTPQI